jgi:hypothetical protein
MRFQKQQLKAGNYRFDSIEAVRLGQCRIENQMLCPIGTFGTCSSLMHTLRYDGHVKKFKWREFPPATYPRGPWTKYH